MDAKSHVASNFQPILTIPLSYTLSLEALDGLDSLSRVESTATVKQPNQLLLDVSGLESRRLWNCTILAFGCLEQSILRGEILSKFIHSIKLGHNLSLVYFL